MGSADGEADESPVHSVYVDAFYMDRYPVTNADYARFLNVFGNREEEGKKWLDHEGPFSSWLCKIRKKDGRFIPKAGYENHPVIKVSWYGARAYSRWVGKRLPTEAEWEKALLSEQVRAMTQAQWDDYMQRLRDPSNETQGEPYPTTQFLPPELYVYGGGGGGGVGDPREPGLVMAWGDSTSCTPPSPCQYASAWMFDYGLDPDGITFELQER